MKLLSVAIVAGLISSSAFASCDPIQPMPNQELQFDITMSVNRVYGYTTDQNMVFFVINQNLQTCEVKSSVMSEEQLYARYPDLSGDEFEDGCVDC